MWLRRSLGFFLDTAGSSCRCGRTSKTFEGACRNLRRCLAMTSMGRDTVTEGVLVGLTTTQLQAICRSTCSSSSCLARESSLSFFSGSASSIFATGDASGAQFGMTKSGSYGLTGLGKQAVRNELATMQHPWTSRRNWVPTSRLVTPALS